MKNLNYQYRRFDDYEKFSKFLNGISLYYWQLDSWQDVGGSHGIDIRAIFVQDCDVVGKFGGAKKNQLPAE